MPHRGSAVFRVLYYNLQFKVKQIPQADIQRSGDCKHGTQGGIDAGGFNTGNLAKSQSRLV